jgi:hypothetical protein
MIRSAVLAAVFSTVVAMPAAAQARYEVSGLGGFTFSEGVNGNAVTTPSGTFTGVNVKNGGSFGFSFAVMTGNGGEVGFQWTRQLSTLGLRGVPSIDLGDMNLDNYHVYFAYNTMPEAKAHPYISIGFGATDYGAVSYTNIAGQAAEINGPVKFSFKAGVGIKTWASDAVGFRASIDWTPTYITSTDEGWWCDPYWGCYLTADSKYSHQLMMSGGVVFRFGGK